MARPTFLIIGAAKAGTTALWNYLATHPEVSMAMIKEPRFFTRVQAGLERGEVDDQIPRSGTFENGWPWLERQFDGEGPAFGEASTVYLVTPDTPALVAEELPGVRLVVVLRDPVSRMYSHYWQERRTGWSFGPFREMLAADHPRIRYFESTSHYRTHLERWLAHVDRGQLLVVTKDRLDAEPEAVLDQVYRHIGVYTGHRPASLGTRFNRQREPRFPGLVRGLERVRALVQGRVPGSVYRAAGRMRRALLERITEEIEYEPLAPDLRAALVPLFEADVAYVEAWTGESLDGWRANSVAEASDG